MKQEIKVANGKYTVVIYDNGRMEALRYGESWNKDLTGDNLVYNLAVELQAARDEIDELSDNMKGAC